MEGDEHAFEFRAFLVELDEGLDVLHRSIEELREATGRAADDRPLLQFETALAEIGGNALTHARTSETRPVEYVLRGDDTKLVAWIADPGPPVNGAWVRDMPPPTSEAGRGLPLARSLLDELDYQHVAGLNRWRLVKRL